MEFVEFFLTVGLVLGLILLANRVQMEKAETFHKLFDLLLIGLNAPLFFLGIMLVFQTSELRSLINLNLDSPTAVGIFLQATAVWGVIVSFRSTRHSLERIIPIDPHLPLHTLALVFSGYFAGSVILQVAGGLNDLAETAVPVSISFFLAQQAGFVVIACLGVGALMRRSWTAVLERLGLGKVNLSQLLESFGWILLLILIQYAGVVLWSAIDPEQSGVVEELSRALYQDFGFWHWLALAVGAGVGEEILFRGALQPVFGIWFTSILFAIVHVQYGFLTPATLVLFILSVILGYIRKRHNTTVAILVHFGYDLTLGLLTLLAGS